MNLERLCRGFRLNYHRIQNLKLAVTYIKYQFELVAWKKSKLKLGAIVFEIKELIMVECVLHEEVEIRFINQDNTRTDELKLENRLKALDWKWDFPHISAFLLLFLGFFVCVKWYFMNWCIDTIPAFVLTDKNIGCLIYFAFLIAFTSIKIPSLRSFMYLNQLLADMLTDVCSLTGILF